MREIETPRQIEQEVAVKSEALLLATSLHNRFAWLVSDIPRVEQASSCWLGGGFRPPFGFLPSHPGKTVSFFWRMMAYDSTATTKSPKAGPLSTCYSPINGLMGFSARPPRAGSHCR